MALTICDETVVAYLAGPELVKQLSLPSEDQIIIAKTSLDMDFPQGILFGEFVKKYPAFWKDLKEKLEQFKEYLVKTEKLDPKSDQAKSIFGTKTVLLAISGMSPIKGVPHNLLIPLRNGTTFAEEHNLEETRVIEIIRPFKPEAKSDKKFDYIIGFIKYAYAGGKYFLYYSQMKLHDFVENIDTRYVTFHEKSNFKKIELALLKKNFPIGSFAKISTDKITLMREKGSSIEHFTYPWDGYPNQYTCRVVGYGTGAEEVFLELVMMDGPNTGLKVIRALSEVEKVVPALPQALEKEIDYLIAGNVRRFNFESILKSQTDINELQFPLLKQKYVMISPLSIGEGFAYSLEDSSQYNNYYDKSLKCYQDVANYKSEMMDCPYIWIMHECDSAFPVSDLIYIATFTPTKINLLSFALDFSSLNYKMSNFDQIWQPVVRALLKNYDAEPTNEDMALINNKLQVGLKKSKYCISLFSNPTYQDRKIKRLKANLTSLTNIHEYNKTLIEKWL